MDSRANAQREQTRRGFSISHQKVVLEIDFSGCLWGYTEITIVPTSKDLKTINLHSRQCTIQTVTVANIPAEFTHYDPLANLSTGPSTEPLDCHRHPELKRKLYSALQESDEGELSISIPLEVALKQSGQSVNPIASEVATPEPQTPGGQPSQPVPEFAPIAINIAYSLRNPVDGFQFVVPTDSYPYRVPHAYTTPSSPDAARCWVPCVDNLWEKCTWEFEFVVPRYLEEISAEDDEPTDASPTLVVCSGELVEQVAHPYSSHKTIFLFSQAVLTSVQHIAFAAGPFHMYSIPLDHIAEDGNSSQPPMYAFCLPGHESHLTTSTSCLRSAMSFYATEFGSYPFGSYKLVFVDEMPTQRFDSSTFTLLTVDLLHGEDAIEQVLETRHALAHALACQWMGINIQPKFWSDSWLVNGLSLYITGLFMKKLFGNNEYRFRLKKDMQRVVERDNGLMPPICQPTRLEPPDAAEMAFINLKAPLVLHILDRKLGKSGTSLGLSRVLPKIFLSALTGDNNTISTHMFLRTCRKVSGVDPRTFAEQWIYGCGCPVFGFSASFNRKKMAVEITMRQECPAYKMLEGNDHAMALQKPVRFFEGQMTVRIHEADGTPYEHVLDIQSPFKRYEVPFNTKYKRVRRNTKRYLARQAAAQAAAEGDTEAAEAMGMVDMGFGLEVWEKESERNNWKVEDWTEEDETAMSGATYEWIRMDADFEWVAEVKFEQPDFMWVSQLQRDRDVVAQLEALHALAQQPTKIVSSTLTKTVLVSNYYFRIRCEAAVALVHCSIPRLDYLGLFHLFKLFLRYCYDPEDPNQDLFAHTYVPKPNDFSDLSEYFVRKSLINAISRTRYPNGKSPSIVRKFLVDQLRYNDNTSNAYADGFYICTIISSAAYATVSTASPERGELLPSEVRTEYNDEDADLLKQTVSEVDRYRNMDRLIPSTHNNVTIACLEFYLVLTVANLIPSAPIHFFPLTREGNYPQVRIAAFDGLFMTKWYSPPIMNYVLAVMAHDPSRIVRRHVARNACQSLALLVQMGEMKLNSKDPESLLIEEDGSVQDKNKESRRSEMDAMIKALRKDKEVGRNEVFREQMMPLALSPEIDHEVRWCLLKLADLLIKPVEEVAPTVKIHIPNIPMTPVTETPPVLTPVAPKLPRPAFKLAGPSAAASPSPVIPNHVLPATKIKIRTTTPGGVRTPPVRKTPSVRTPSLEPQARERERGVAFAVPALPAKVKAKAPPPSAPKAKPQHAKPNGVAKPVHTLKAQASGMSSSDLRATRSALKKLQSHKHAKIFLYPVDPIRDHAPNYFDVVKEPMDLQSMAHKLEGGKYTDRFAFQADFRLMMANAKLYNPAGSFAHDETLALETYFEKQWTIINKTLEAAHAKAAQKPPPPPPPKVLPPVPRAFSNPPAPEPTPSTSRPTPMIKFKPPQPKETAPKPPKPPKRKTKVELPPEVPDPPPPPYVDDGSHDILQEVLALERQQKSTNGKRKKVDISEGEDDPEGDLLALATPAKKGRPSPPEPSTSALPKIVLNSHKPKPPPVETNESRRSSVSVDAPRISIKGKEKEVSRSTSTHRSKPPSPVSPVHATPIDEKKCKQILSTLMKLPEGGIFLRPVDPVLDGCPTYLDEIKHPMDFGTISSELSAHGYETMEELRSDIDLVFTNCKTFNPPATFPWNCADAVEKVFKKEWIKAMEKKLSANEKRGLQGVITALVKEDISWVFREPVDPVLLQIPTYFDVVKHPRDLRTIKNSLNSDKYDSIEAFEADIQLMLDNAILFNGLESEVGALAVGFRDRFRELMRSWKNGANKKRKDGEKTSTQPAKKIKIG
ncbi:transcription initiation factor TFIID subunit 2 [Favolaschia claudopus]|uniref:Transcription initiation factor TFIID subunit 2 n=1 Tax=Favolaschia claudopus TaxID=2862362 RepID=A0AAW0EDS1_9AGAR